MPGDFARILEETSAQGRKRLPVADRRRAILDAAREVFFKKGYSATSLDDVIRLSGGSRRSIYTEFGSKRGLFNALLAEASSAVYGLLDSLDARPMAMEAMLNRAGTLIMEGLFSEEWNFMRIVLVESMSVPELAVIYHENGPVRVENKVARLMEGAVDRDALGIADCTEAAGICIGMLRNAVYSRFLFQSGTQMDAADIRHLVRSLVRVLLYGVARGCASGAQQEGKAE
ncbi:MAG: TetR/AcrR family transcriptional regulator [Desulfovibrio sp.]|nr:TetR/AcrR family transcriptional regulator [Desulfovibrio sp.]